MIQPPKGAEPLSYEDIRAIALLAMQRWAWATSEDQDRLGSILGPAVDTAENRRNLAKVLENLGRPK